MLPGCSWNLNCQKKTFLDFPSNILPWRLTKNFFCTFQPGMGPNPNPGRLQNPTPWPKKKIIKTCFFSRTSTLAFMITRHDPWAHVTYRSLKNDVIYLTIYCFLSSAHVYCFTVHSGWLLLLPWFVSFCHRPPPLNKIWSNFCVKPNCFEIMFLILFIKSSSVESFNK